MDDSSTPPAGDEPPPWAEIDRLFRETIRLPEAQRAEFLKQECAGDAQLLAEVESLLAQDTPEFMEEPLLGDTARVTPLGLARAPSAEPETVGPYHIVRKIGEGGMGVVFLAQQKEPVNRRVALKIVKWGMDTREVLARFDGERQALSLMDHPNITRVIDAGATREGRPYFVMEYVPGISLLEYCDQNKLEMSARIELFIQICKGVQHAHQKGIIHRDLKPSNILVTVPEQRPVPKIIDFGIAKATAQRLTEQTVFTQQGQIVGTPEYMSPEQALSSALDVDTRSDVYSLGVVLYELLVGALPFEAQALRSAGYAGIQQMICDVEPTRPSTKLSTLGPAARAAAATRRTEVRTLSRQLKGDLDWIVMKCLEKDRTRRYESTAELGADLRRHLDFEPVLAGPPSAVYRMKKFARKHRSGVVTALLVFFGLAVSFGWALVERERATRDRDLANHRAEEILRLSDIKILQDAETAAEELWPARPALVTAMKQWLEEYGLPLKRRLSEHQAYLRRLRIDALPYDDEQRERDRETHPRAAKLAARETARADVRATGAETEEEARSQEARAAELTNEIEELRKEVGERRTWKFTDSRVQWQHDTLRELVKNLERFVDPDPFVGSLTSVRRRLDRAETIRQRTMTETRVARRWAEARDAIRSSKQYGGFDLAVQVGLIPLGVNPQGLWEFWHTESGKEPVADASTEATSRWRLTEETGMVLVLVPRGSFWMGAQSTDPSGINYDPQANDAHEAPPTRVSLWPFFISKYEMTQPQWHRLTGEWPSFYGPGSPLLKGPCHPVEQVSWNDCHRYLRRWGLALPTEAQWERAARGGTQLTWWCGTNRTSVGDPVAGNLSDALSRRTGAPTTWRWEEWEDAFAIHAPVGSFPPNPFGIHDTIGNLWEWCRDTTRPYKIPPRPGDGLRASAGGSSYSVRGGAYNNDALSARAAKRDGNTPENRGHNLGVRPVLELWPAN